MELGARVNCMYSNVAIKRAEKGFDGGGGVVKSVFAWEAVLCPTFLGPERYTDF